MAYIYNPFTENLDYYDISAASGTLVDGDYAKLAGRAGGQILNGGTAETDGLYLRGTSHISGGIVSINNFLDIGSRIDLLTSQPVINITPLSTVNVTAGLPIILNAGFNIAANTPLFTFKLFYANTAVTRAQVGAGDAWYLISVFDSYFRSSSNTLNVPPYAPNGLLVRNELTGTGSNVGSVTKDVSAARLVDVISSTVSGAMLVSNYHGIYYSPTLNSERACNLNITNMYGNLIKKTVVNATGSLAVTNCYGIKVEDLRDSKITNAYQILLEGSGPTTGISFDTAERLYSDGTNLVSAAKFHGSGGFMSADGTTGSTGTITIAGLTSITVKNGLITAWA